MTNLLTPLKKLGKKMTGQDISGSNLVTVVDDIANKYDGSGGGGEGGGGGGVFYITATWDDSANGYVLDKTVAQIEAAYANGQLCQIVGEMDTVVRVEDTPFGTLVSIVPTTYVDVGSNQLDQCIYDLNPQTGVISLTEYLYTLTPVS